MSLASVFLSVSFFYLIVFLVISFLLSVYFSRKYSLSGFKKYFLITVKTLSLFILLSLTANPSLSYRTSETQNTKNIILIDNSRSILTDSKPMHMSEIFSVNSFNRDNYINFLFSDELKHIDADSIINFKTDGYKTSLSSALDKLSMDYNTNEIGSITVISDGNFDENPVYKCKMLQVPFISVMVGDTAKKKDVILKSVTFNEKSYTMTNVLIRAEINSYFYNGPVNVNLLRENSVLVSKTVFAQQDKKNLFIDFNIKENSPAKIKYKIEILPVEGELTVKNNYREFFIIFHERYNNLLVISGGPGYDHQSVVSVIRRIADYKTTLRTLKTSDEFYEGGIGNDIFNKLALVVLLNFPVNNASPNLISRISEEITSRSLPVAFFSGRNTDYQKLKVFGELIPFDISSQGNETSVNVNLLSGDENPYLINEKLFSSIPASLKNINYVIPKPGAKTLMVNKTTGEPLVLTRTYEDTKSTSVLFYGIWKWNLNPANDNSKITENFIRQTINFTAGGYEKTKFRIWPSKDIFDYRENPVILAEVLDENNMPTTNAKITGIIFNSPGTKIKDFVFEPAGGKIFKSILKDLPAGDYRIEAVCETRGVYYGKDSTRFLCDTLNNEFMITNSNYNSMYEIALNTGGTLIMENKFSEIPDVIDSISVRKNITSDLYTEKINLREKLWMLVFIIILFTAEWVFRKRNNLP